MSQINAERSKEVVGAAKLISGREIEKEDEGIEINLIDPQNGWEVKGCLAKIITDGLETVKDLAGIDVDDVKEEDEPEAYIQFLFDPEFLEVVLNEYVINEIAKYVDYQDLKSLRHVNKLWSNGAKRQFVQNSVFALVSEKRYENHLAAFRAETEKLKGITALRTRPPHGYGLEENVEIFTDILASLAPTLNALELQHWTDNAIFLLRAPIQFPALSSLTLMYCSFNMKTWRLLYASAPNLKELVFQRYISDILSPFLETRTWYHSPYLND